MRMPGKELSLQKWADCLMVSSGWDVASRVPNSLEASLSPINAIYSPPLCVNWHVLWPVGKAFVISRYLSSTNQRAKNIVRKQSFPALLWPSSLRHPPMYSKSLSFYDFLSFFFVTILKIEGSTSLEHGIWGNLNLYSQAVVTHMEPGINRLFYLFEVRAVSLLLLAPSSAEALGVVHPLLTESMHFSEGLGCALCRGCRCHQSGWLTRPGTCHLEMWAC